MGKHPWPTITAFQCDELALERPTKGPLKADRPQTEADDGAAGLCSEYFAAQFAALRDVAKLAIHLKYAYEKWWRPIFIKKREVGLYLPKRRKR